MKKINFSIIVLFLILTLCACNGKEGKDNFLVPPFAGQEWYFYNEAAAEHDVLSFREDGSFSYHCECGEPVGDADLYDSYRYDEENLDITLYNDYDDNEKTVKLLSYNVMHLLLEIDGEIRDFTTVKTETESNFWWEAAESYLSGYNMTRTLLEFTEDGVMTAAFHYDTETDYPKGTREEFAIAQDAVFFDLSIFSSMNVEDGMAKEEFYDVAYTELAMDEMKVYLEENGAPSYLWLNDQMEIEKAVVFGLSVLYE